MINRLILFKNWMLSYTPTQVESIGRYFYAMSIASGVIVEKLYRLSGIVTFEMVVYATIFTVTLLLGIRCHRGTQKGG